MAGSSDRQLNRRERLLVDLLPAHNWNVGAAGVAAGYSRAYANADLTTRARDDPCLSEAIRRKQTEIVAPLEDRRTKRLADLDRIIEDPKTPCRDRIRAIQVQGQMSGWLSETRVLETGPRQRELNDSQLAEAKRLALLRFQTWRLPGDAGPAVIDAEPSTEPAIIDVEPDAGRPDDASEPGPDSIDVAECQVLDKPDADAAALDAGCKDATNHVQTAGKPGPDSDAGGGDDEWMDALSRL